MDPTNLNTTDKAVIALVALIFFAGIFIATTFFGDPKNSLHISAQSWSIVAGLAILAGLGFPNAVAALVAWRSSSISPPAAPPTAQ